MTLVLATPSFAGADVYGTAGIYSEYGGGGHESHALVGGGASGIFAGGKAAVFGEFDYIPMGSTLGVSVKQIDAGGGVRIYVGPKSDKFRLFVPVEGGLARLSAGLSGVSAGINGAYFGSGFGAEIGSKKFGVRPEFRFEREQWGSGGGGNYVTTIGASFYYRFGN
jgi:hypothetical protein